jgi:hypothetical protein
MVNKKNWLGIMAVLPIAAMLVFGMAVVGCSEDDTLVEDVTKITITQITGKTGTATLLLYSTFSTGANPVAGGQGTISNESVTFEMQKEGGAAWDGFTDGGSYMMFLKFDTDNSYYAYTERRTFEQLEITSENDLNSKLPKKYIGLGGSYDFSDFRNISEI